MRVAVPVLFLFVLLSGCKLNTDYFSEYRGLNLLKDYDFDDFEADGTTPKWNLATSTDFMTWERIGDPADPNNNLSRDQAAATPTAGPDGVSPVYRLEIKNLIPNGDFEDGAVTAEGQTTLPAFWSTATYTGSAVATPSGIQFGVSPSPTTRPGSISGRSLGWAGVQAGDQLRLDLYSATTSVRPSAWSAGKYRFRCELINVSEKAEVAMYLYTLSGLAVSQAVLADREGNWTVTTTKSDDSVDHASIFPSSTMFLTNTEFPNDEGRTLAFGHKEAVGPYAAVIDNVRLVPDDQTLGVQARFPRLDSGAAPLLPGTEPGMYVFAVYVRNDPTAGTLNRFQPADLSVQLKAAVKPNPKATPTYQSAAGLRPAGGWSDWTLLTFKMGFDFVNLNSELDGKPALTITLSPTNGSTGDADVGSLLVSQPVLTFNP